MGVMSALGLPTMGAGATTGESNWLVCRGHRSIHAPNRIESNRPTDRLIAYIDRLTPPRPIPPNHSVGPAGAAGGGQPAA